MADDAVLREFHNLLLDVRKSLAAGGPISLTEWLYIRTVLAKAKRFVARLEDNRARWN